MKSESYCFIQCMPVEHQCLLLFCQVSLPSFLQFDLLLYFLSFYFPVVVEYQPNTYSGPRPEFGKQRCFFGNDLASFIFFHLPLLVIQVK